MDQNSEGRSNRLASNKLPSEDEISTLLELFREQIALGGNSKNEGNEQDSSERQTEYSHHAFDLDYLINKRVSSFAIPSFSTTTLTIVWVLNLLVCLLCFVLAEIYHEHLDTFPLILLVILGCHLITANNFFSYLLGRHRHGAHRYQLYQPFKGGHRFVIIQFFGISCVVLCLVVAFAYTLFLLSSNSRKDVHNGLYTTSIVFGVAGNILLYLSPNYFQPRDDGNVSRQTDGKHENPTSNATFLTPSAFLELLYISPNCESALIVIFAIAQSFMSVLATLVPYIATFIGISLFLIQVLGGAIIHFLIGHAYKPGYRFVALRLHSSTDTIGFWAARALYIGSLIVNAALMKNPAILHEASFLLVCVAALNIFSIIIFLFFVRTASFRATDVTQTNSIFQFYGAVLNIVTYLLATASFTLILYITLHESELKISESGRSAKDFLHFCLQLILVFSLFLAPITQAGGCAIYGANFAILHNFQGSPAFIFVQCGFLLLYLSEFMTTVLFLFTGTYSYALVASISSAFSITCITFSGRLYNAKPNRLRWFDSSDSIASITDSNEDHSHTQGSHPGKASKQRRSESETTSDRLRSLFLNGREYNENEKSGNLQLGSLFNAGMICAYICALASFTLCLVLDLSDHYMWFYADIPRSKVLLLECLFFAVSVPLANFSARSKDIHMLYPLSRNTRFTVLHTLSWTLHMIGIVGNLFLFDQFQAKDYTVALSTHTVRGFLQFIPLILITIYIAMEYKNDVQNRQHRSLSVQALHTLNQILSKMAEKVERKEDKDALQVLFSAVSEPILQTFGVLDFPEMFHLHFPTKMGLDNEGDGQEHNEASPHLSSVCAKERAASAFSASLSNYATIGKATSNARPMLNTYERERRHQDIGIVVMLLSLASASLFALGSIPSTHEVFRLGCAVLGLIVCTGSCLGIHVGYGALLHENDSNYAFFMPFRGGAAFTSYQSLGWTAYASVLILTLVVNEVPEVLGGGGMVLAMVLSSVAQFSLFKSIPKYTPPTTKHFLDQNGEAAVAVLVFSCTFALNRLHMLFEYHLKDGSQGRMSYKFSTRGLLYITNISVLLAVPLVLLAMGRTTQQWRRVRSRMACQPPKEGNNSENEQDIDADSDAQDDLKRMCITIVTNTLEIGTIILTMTAPFPALFFLYYVFSNYTYPLLNAVSYYLPFMLWVAVGTLLISAVPYMQDVGVPRIVLDLRSEFLTYAVYSLPLYLPIIFVLPLLLVPRLSTAFSLFCTLILTVGGVYKQVRWALRILGYAIIGYLIYKEITRCLDEFKKPYSNIWILVLSRLRVCILDVLIMGTWIWYISLYRGKPYHTGSQRSPWFKKFMKRHISELAKYFSFRLILDSTKVDMRDSRNKYLFSFHPHGVLPGTALTAPFTDVWEEKVGTNAKTCVATHCASVVFNVPLIRDFNLRLNALSVNRGTIEASLDRGDSAIIVTGGQSEMLRTVSTDKFLELVAYHVGFVRIAIRKRVPLVPLLCFGEQNILGFLQFPRIQRLALMFFGFPFPMIFYGRFLLPLPRKTPLTLVVGPPIDIPADADPENEEHVKKLAEVYFQEIEKLFYRYRVEAGYPEMVLRLIKRESKGNHK